MVNLRVGLIGAGVMGKNHLRILNTLEGVDLVGIADPIDISDISTVNPKCKIFNNYQELLSAKIDYCVITTPTGFHKEVTVAALKSGVSCLIEKPIAVNYQESIEILHEASKHKLLIGVGHIERYNAAISQLKNRLAAGELGRIYQIALRRQGPFPSRVADVGVVKDLATHDLDLATWLTDSKFISVNANVAHRSGREHEDLLVMNGVLENNVLVNLLVNWLSPLKERNIVVTGEMGTFVVDTLNSDLTYYENGMFEVSQDSYLHFKGVAQGKIVTFAFDKPEPLLIEHQNFRDALLGKKSQIVTLQQGIEVVRVADAVIQSSRINQSISL